LGSTLNETTTASFYTIDKIFYDEASYNMMLYDMNYLKRR